MSDHSPEPWVVHERRGFRCGADEFFIREQSPPELLPGEDIGWGKEIGEVGGKANATRIVACVNACKGVSTTSLIRASRGELLVVLGKSAAVAKALREGKDQ